MTKHKLLEDLKSHFETIGAIRNLAQECNQKLIDFLLKDSQYNDEYRSRFFLESAGMLVFKQLDFLTFLDLKNLGGSFTSYASKIGLSSKTRGLLKASNEVVLNFAYKDGVLKGGQSKDEEKQDEIFFNEILAKDEIDALFEPKALWNFEAIGDKNLEELIAEESNILLKGNNLLALHSLKKKYRGKVKLIYIDPPYNTGSDSFKYNDKFNHSTWLTFMKNRLEIAREFLRDDGVIFVQCDDNEQAYLKVLMDEIFGRENFVNTISTKLKDIAGASGGGEDKRLKKNVEYILIYAKSYSIMSPFRPVFDSRELYSHIKYCRENDISWKYGSVLLCSGDKKLIATTQDGSGDEIKIFERTNYIIKSIKQICTEEGIDEKEVYYQYIDKIFRTTMPQSSIRLRVLEALEKINHHTTLISIEYTPKSGKNKGQIYEQFYGGDKLNLYAWLRDVTFQDGDKILKRELVGTLWNFVSGTKNLTKEGDIKFENAKKPEALIQRIIELSTDNGDIVMDFFSGSGTTLAVAHKMGRKWIGIEQMDYIQDITKERLKKVIDGEQGGISKVVEWKGGGSFVYAELMPFNAIYRERIEASQDEKELEAIYKDLEEKAFLDYRIDLQEILVDQDFKNMSLEDKKETLRLILDENMDYVPLGDIEDKTYGIDEDTIRLNKVFYREEQ